MENVSNPWMIGGIALLITGCIWVLMAIKQAKLDSQLSALSKQALKISMQSRELREAIEASYDQGIKIAVVSVLTSKQQVISQHFVTADKIEAKVKNSKSRLAKINHIKNVLFQTWQKNDVHLQVKGLKAV